jgi:hypothetical protein
MRTLIYNLTVNVFIIMHKMLLLSEQFQTQQQCESVPLYQTNLT